MSLSGVTSGNIGFDEKIAIADAIFRSLKNTTVDDGLDPTVFIESITVDGEEDLFTQYQPLRNETVVFGTKANSAFSITTDSFSEIFF